MNKTAIIIRREFMTRVTKRSFIVMTLLGPIFMAAILIVPIWIKGQAGKSLKKIQILDKNQTPDSIFQNTQYLNYEITDKATPAQLKDKIKSSDYDALVYIPQNFPDSTMTIYSYQHIELDLKKEIKSTLEQYIENKNLDALGITQDQIKNAKQDIKIKTVKWSETGSETIGSAQLNTIIGLIISLLVYMFIFIYGAQVMRGVLEEKTGRIVEVLISSVKPFELMSGKIIGIALLALTQFVLWIVLTFAIINTAGAIFPEVTQQQASITQTPELSIPQNTMQAEILPALNDYNWTNLIIGFAFFFMAGYLLYAALFAAVGSAVDNETDTQQFTLPITIPLIIAILMAQGIINNPSGPIAFWFSIIPFTAPIVMPARIAFDAVTTMEIITSVVLMLATIACAIWLASKIYRNGILNYGKKSNYADLLKWIRQK